MAPTFSRSQRKQALKHVLENVLQEEPNDLIAKALSKWGGNNIDDLLAITEDDIKDLDYNEEIEDPADSSKTITTTRDLPKSRKARIRLFQGYVAWISHKGTPIEQSLTGWESITIEGLDEYRVSHYARVPFASSYPQATPTPPTSRNDPVEQFRRGIKRDIGLYEPLNDDNLWDSWNAQLVATARAQNIDDALNPTYVPSSGDDALFEEKPKFMYTVSLIPQLNDAKLRADQYKSASGHETTYQDYHSFLTTAAQQYDRTFTKNAQSTRRKIYQHDFHPTQLHRFDDDYPYGTTMYNIDTQVETIFVNQTITAGGVTLNNKASVIAICHQYAYTGRGKSIHSSAQLEQYKNSVDDRTKANGGMQRIITLDGYIIPLSFRGGLAYIPMRSSTNKDLSFQGVLAYIPMRSSTNKEFEILPHVIMISDEEWDPTILDSEVDTDTEEWFDTVTTELAEEVIVDRRFDDVGDYRHRHVMQHSYMHKHEEEEIFHDAQLLLEANERITTPSTTDYEAVRPMLAWQSVEVIKKMFGANTQFVKIPLPNVLRKTFRSPNPTVNTHMRPEAVATDTVFSDVPAVDSGDMAAQIFVGVESLVPDAEGMKYSDKQLVNTLEDNIRKRGAMDKLISDRAQTEISNKVKDILGSLHVSDWQSEPFHQHQNFAERRIQEINKVSNTILDGTGAPPHLWLQALLYSYFLLNHLATFTLLEGQHS